MRYLEKNSQINLINRVKKKFNDQMHDFLASNLNPFQPNWLKFFRGTDEIIWILVLESVLNERYEYSAVCMYSART